VARAEPDSCTSGARSGPAREVWRQLAAQDISTSVSPADHAQFDLPRRGLSDLVRASVHYYNTDTGLDRLAAALPAGPRMT
jgi:selenocysteine lyase/cysteine desulfurase